MNIYKIIVKYATHVALKNARIPSTKGQHQEKLPESLKRLVEKK